MINLIGIGGAGNSITSDIYKLIREAIPNNIPMKTYSLYSSDDDNDENDTDKFKSDVNFRFTSTDIGSKELKGSGGDRRKNAVHFVKGIQTFMNSQKTKPFHKAITGDAVNFIFHSGSKGTGSVAGPLLAKVFGEQSIPYVVFLVVDGEDEFTIINNINTLTSYGGIAKTCNNNPLISIHLNGEDGKSEKDVNKDILDKVIVMGLLGSGCVNKLDEEDYNTFVDLTKYTSYNFEPGVMLLSMLKKDESGEPIPLDKGLVPVVARIIDNSTTKSEPLVKARHRPHGWITDDYKGLIPTTVVSSTGYDKYATTLLNMFNSKRVNVKMSSIDDNLMGDMLKPEPIEEGDNEGGPKIEYFKPFDFGNDEGLDGLSL